MTVDATTASDRNTRLQVRHGGVAEVAITAVSDINSGICSTARVVTAGACRPVVVLRTADKNVSGTASRIHVVDTAVSCGLVGMTIETGGCCACSDHIDNRLCRAVVTGGTGAGAVGGDVMLDALYLSPGRDDMTFAAKLPVRLVAAHGNGMRRRMR